MDNRKSQVLDLIASNEGKPKELIKQLCVNKQICSYSVAHRIISELIDEKRVTVERTDRINNAQKLFLNKDHIVNIYHKQIAEFRHEFLRLFNRAVNAYSMAEEDNKQELLAIIEKTIEIFDIKFDFWTRRFRLYWFRLLPDQTEKLKDLYATFFNDITELQDEIIKAAKSNPEIHMALRRAEGRVQGHIILRRDAVNRKKGLFEKHGFAKEYTQMYDELI